MTTATSFHPRELRKAFGRFASGVTVVTTSHDSRTHGMTANAFVSVSLDPPLVLISVDHRAHLHQILPSSKRYGVSVLAEDQEALSDHFAGRAGEVEIEFVERSGMPLLAGALAYFVVDVVDMHPAGDHTLYIGRVEHFEARDGSPLLFHAGKYERIQSKAACMDPLSEGSVAASQPVLTR